MHQHTEKEELATHPGLDSAFAHIQLWLDQAPSSDPERDRVVNKLKGNKETQTPHPGLKTKEKKMRELEGSFKSW